MQILFANIMSSNIEYIFMKYFFVGTGTPYLPLRDVTVKSKFVKWIFETPYRLQIQ